MRKLLIGGAALLFSAAAVSQVAPATSGPVGKVHTRADVQAKVAEHFAKADANRDGAVTKAEADAASKAVRAHFAKRMKARHDGRREHAFERLDANRDGAISRAEWYAGAALREQRMASRDRDGDGRPDRRGFRHMGGIGGHMFEMADADKDGRVTLQEAQAAALKHFDMADTNRDGQVTRDERREMHTRMRAQHRG